MEHVCVRFGPIRLFVCEPQVAGGGRPTGYGNLLRHVEQALRVAHHLDVSLHLIEPARPLNAAVFAIESDRVRVIPPSHRAAPLLRAAWRLGTPFRYGAPLAWLAAAMASAARPAAHALMLAARRRQWRRLDRWCDRVERRLRDVVAAYAMRWHESWKRLTAEARDRARAQGLKRRPARVRLPAKDEREVLALAERAGLDPARPMVTLHVREAGYRVRPAERQRAFDRLRNASIEDYRPAIEWLVGQGIQVVRIGDRTMTPVPWPGVVDLATASWRTDAFELWAMARSRFFIASDSGPYFLAELVAVPSLAVNVLQVGYYTLRPHDRYICKLVRDRASGRQLSLLDMLTDEFVRTALDETRYEWLDNEAADVAEAVRDMVNVLGGGEPSRTPAQRRHDEALAALTAGWRPGPRSPLALQLRKGGPGTVSRGFADRYLEP